MKKSSVLLIVWLTIALTLNAEEAKILVPRGVNTLRQNAVTRSEFTFDHSMLILASKLDRNDDLQRVIAGISGITVRKYRLAVSPWSVEQTALNSLNDEYRAAGWKKLMSKNHEANSSMTNIWGRMENNAISNVAILISRADEVNFVSISGSISPADLSHLSGHFGIPLIEGGVKVPNPPNKP
jgi:hypothetical protein